MPPCGSRPGDRLTEDWLGMLLPPRWRASYAELWGTLETLEHRAKGAFDLEAAPLQSNTGRDIPVVTVGDGPTSVMFIATQHGNEYVVGEEMLGLLHGGGWPGLGCLPQEPRPVSLLHQPRDATHPGLDDGAR